MSAIKYIVNINEEEKKKLEVIINAPRSKTRARIRARILLLTDSYPKWSAKRVSQGVMCSESMVNKIRKGCVEQGVIECLMALEVPLEGRVVCLWVLMFPILGQK